MRVNRRTVGAFAATAMLLVGGGAALAASGGNGDRTARCEARVLARIDAAEKAGRISPERAARLRERVEQGASCVARPRVARVAAHSMVRAAARFLGLDHQELRAQLPGTSLAALAEKQGKTVSALEDAMVAPAEARLARAVANGRITQARADALLERLERVADRLATHVFPTR
jgi:hypothetical protein